MTMETTRKVTASHLERRAFLYIRQSSLVLDPKFYLQHISNGLNKMPGAIGADEMKEYERAFSNSSAIHATCEDFRAAADIDLEMDEADDKAGRKIQCPLRALWGAKGTVGPLWDVLATWREKCAVPVTGRALDCGHFLQEERPQEILTELLQFFSAEKMRSQQTNR